MKFHLNFLSDHIVQCGPFHPILRCHIFSDTFHSPGPIFVIDLWLDHSFLELLLIPLLLTVTTYHFQRDRGHSRYPVYPFHVF
jgi:hypothetical protein